MNNNIESSWFFSEKMGKNLSILGIAFALITSIIFLVFGNWKFSSAINEEKIGQFGDFIGGVIGSAFSLVGIILFYVALKEQRKDIKINQESAKLQTEALRQQIQEFELQRSELEETRKVVQEQSETLKFQRFENTFFNLLSLHHQIVEGIDEIQKERNGNIENRFYNRNSNEQINHVVYSGRDVFNRSFNRLINQIERDPHQDYLKIYLTEYKENQTDFGHYFRNLYRIIKFIDNTIFNPNTIENYQFQYQYTSMVRAQLSDYELVWIFYNCLSENGNEKFKPLVEKYSLLKNMPKDKIHDQNIISLYAESAFINKAGNRMMLLE
ncbi:putative phage abortive infection protein [Sphingobacterium tabacisoli]|uniref:Phage abortive infection protein n=1 Tax=Sphingobacterium tabacisoli TaxID=2044855 RepID=A0ABW5L498_9SPHI|nr:putative phage abortive infection protein [Sphingobacterium tabacisoli]